MSADKKNGHFPRAIIALGVMLAGCAGAPAEENVTNTYESFEAFEAATYREKDTGIYIVDGDTPIDDIKKLEEFYEIYVREGALAVLRTGGQDAKWNDTKKLNLTYCVSTTFGSRHSTVVQAMADATSAWQAAANVKYIYVPAQDGSCTAQNTNVVFDVRPTNSGGNYIARSFFPGDPRSSTNVLIDNSAFSMSGQPTLTGVLRHELGHTLGFRHEHTRPEAGTCFEDNNWRPLTPYDSKSIMHYPQCNGGSSDLEFSAQDGNGVRALYGS